MLHKISLLLNTLHGYFQKFLIDVGVYNAPSLNTSNGVDVVVSLTSYGRRVSSNIVYYTIVSILRQTIQPHRIILWLAEEEWNEEILPTKISSLKRKGVEIRYCKDIRSYKKLIPTLMLCPDSCIVTADDDMIYSKNWLECIINGHKDYPNDIICLNSSCPQIKNGIPVNYQLWKDYPNETSSKLIFPVGVGGTLYPAGALHRDVVDSELFLKLCPIADDIWFWFCGLRNGTNKRYIIKNNRDTSFDRLYQTIHVGSALTHSNKFEHQNDKQFRDLFNYYKVRLTDNGDLIGCES